VAGVHVHIVVVVVVVQTFVTVFRFQFFVLHVPLLIVPTMTRVHVNVIVVIVVVHAFIVVSRLEIARETRFGLVDLRPLLNQVQPVIFYVNCRCWRKC